MSAERKKLLWIALSVTIFVLVLAATGFFLFAPKKTGGSLSAPASVGNTAAPKAADPQDFLMTPPPPPPSDQSNPGGNVIVVYGDKPASLGGTPGAAGQQAGSATASGGGASAGPEASLAAAQGSLGGQSQAAAQPSAEAPRPSASVRQGGERVAAARVATARGGSAQEASYRERAKAAAPRRVTEYWIQAASFTSRDRADGLKHELANKGIASLITVKNLAGTSWYRVRVGPYSIKAEAESWLGKVQSIPNCGSANLWTDVALRSR
ncbi:MAG TPA: SPOR domain-containing protein [Rectinemataceae bacterium]|nr:SPOR domain-containing protein [Rectinemataceae bacterium]